MNADTAIKFTDDGKGKYQSVEATLEFQDSGPMGVLNFSAVGYGEDQHEAFNSLMFIIARSGIRLTTEPTPLDGASKDQEKDEGNA